MQRLLFFSRVAFICNACFLITLVMRYLPPVQEGHIGSTILILGIGLSFVLNILINLIIIVFLLGKKPVWDIFPRWLIIINALLLIPQIILLIK